MNGNRRPSQVLGLVDDLSNHPLALFVAEGLPVVVAPDDPGFWGAVGLSDDWTLALLAAAGRCGAMRLAKQLATLQGIRDAEARAHAQELGALKQAFEERLSEVRLRCMRACQQQRAST